RLGARTALPLPFRGAPGSGSLTPTTPTSASPAFSLALRRPPSTTHSLYATDRRSSYAPVLGVVDARGTGAGWNLSISATSFSDGAGHTLAPGTVSAVAQACHAASSCTLATNAIGYPLTVTGVAAKVFNAAVNTGLGKVDVTPTVDVLIPGTTFAGTYTSTVTVSVVAGP